MKTKPFDTLNWIRRLRDEHYRQDAGLSDEQKIAKARIEAEQFRASRQAAQGRKRTRRRSAGA